MPGYQKSRRLRYRNSLDLKENTHNMTLIQIILNYFSTPILIIGGRMFENTLL